VSEFVEALKTELESTFKEEISVYFDINPHDGLLETHDVDASLKEKLKCLIFIPIISRTYCDPKSFAWEHEFKAFVEQASQDQFGLKVKLPNGNVASRVLLVRIHDLDIADIKECESVLGGFLRGVEFIYKEPGVNKPLSTEDDERKNLNNTKYRIQINKVANAIKEIISGLKTKPEELDKEIIQQKSLLKEIQKKERLEVQKQPAKLNKRKLITGSIATAVLLLFVALFAFPKIFYTGKSKIAVEPGGKISIVVGMFENKTGDATMDSWRDIIPDLLRGYLATSKELSVQSSQTMFEVYESIKNGNNTSSETSQSNEVAKRLNADFYLTGSYQKIRNKTLIVVRLINTNSREILMTRSLEGNLDTDYKNMTDSLSRQIKDFLEIKALEKNANPEYGAIFTNSVEAYRKYIEGMKSIMKGDYSIAAKALEEAYRIDSTFTLAAFFCANAYIYFDFPKAVYWQQKAYIGKEKLPIDYKMWLEMWNAYFTTRNPNEILIYANSIMKSDTKSRFIIYDVGTAFNEFGKYDQAIEMFDKVEKISMDWGEAWKFREYYYYFASACHNANMFEKEGKVLENGMKLFPNDIELIWSKGRDEISNGNPEIADELISKFRYLSKQAGLSESEIEERVGNLYEESKSFDKAEDHYRKALSLEPENPTRMNSLAYLLIDKNRNVIEGLELADKALKINPNNYEFLHTKGWGLFRLGKTKEALEQLKKSWDLIIGSNGTVYSHLEEVKKAIANLK
jgi:tetratricopeptide (TPR) repeat protein